MEINNIRNLRKLLDIPIKEISKEFLVTENTFRTWESGFRFPNRIKLVALREIFMQKFYKKYKTIYKKGFNLFDDDKNKLAFSIDYLEHKEITDSDKKLLNISFKMKYHVEKDLIFYFPNSKENLDILKRWVNQQVVTCVFDTSVYFYRDINYDDIKSLPKIDKKTTAINELILDKCSKNVNIFYLLEQLPTNPEVLIFENMKEAQAQGFANIQNITNLFW